MVVVKLRSPLRELAGGSSELQLDGRTVGEVISRLEGAHPKLIGWLIDERGRVRPHVNLFLNGERATLDARVEPKDRSELGDRPVVVRRQTDRQRCPGSAAGEMVVLVRIAAGSPGATLVAADDAVLLP